MHSLVTIALAGAFGAVSRHLLSGWAARLPLATTGLPGLPVGTLLVNVLGSFALGLLVGLTLTGERLPAAWRPALTTGFLGSFTTFSTFSVETVRLAEQGDWRLVAFNLLLQLALGLGAALAGLAAGRGLG